VKAEPPAAAADGRVVVSRRILSLSAAAVVELGVRRLS
jgi:hypothetical protein